MPHVAFPSDDTVQVVIPGKQPPQTMSFTFDKIFSNPNTPQPQIYNLAAKETVNDVLQGYNGTIFAYGQTGSGKTWTMFGSDIQNQDLQGIIPRAASHIFEFIRNDKAETEYVVKCSFLEIYKEVVRDLLNPKNDNLKVRETPAKGVWVDDLSEEEIGSEAEALDLIKYGEEFRIVSSTNMNEKSSRSHSLFIMSVHQKSKDGSSKTGKLNLVDLAGSEKVAKTGSRGETLEEAKKINQSLSALGNVINALTQTNRPHVPYRDSKLTFILRESLGGNCKTTLMITASSHLYNLEETISTLKFGQRAKSIKNSPFVNKQRSIEELLEIIRKLTDELAQLKKYLTYLENEISVLKSKDGPFDLAAFRSQALAALGISPSLVLGANSAFSPRKGEGNMVDTMINTAELQLQDDRVKEKIELQLQDLRDEIASLSESKALHEEEIAGLKKELGDKDQLIESLNSETSRQKSELATIKSKYEYELQQAGLDAKNSKIALQSATYFSKELETILSKEKQDKEMYLQERHKLTRELDDLRHRCDDAEKIAKSSKTKTEELTSTNQQLTNTLEQRAEQIKELNAKVTKLEEELGIQTYNKTSLENQVNMLNGQIEISDFNLKALKQKNEDLEMRLKQVQAEKQDINEVSNEITLRITELQQTLDQLGDENGVLKTQVNQLKSDLKMKEVEVEDKQHKLTQQEQKTNEALSRIEELMNEVKAVQKVMKDREEELTAQINELNESKAQALKKNEELEGENQKIAHEKSAVEEELSKTKRELQDANNKNEIQVTQIDQSNKRIEELQSTIDNMRAEFDKQRNEYQQARAADQEEIARLKTQLELANGLAGKLQQEITGLRKDAKKQQGKVVAVRTVSGRNWGDIMKARKAEIVRDAKAKAEKEGWLTKQGAVVRSWRKRWCVVRGDKLLYFADNNNWQNKEPKGFIPLVDCVAQPADDETKKPYSFGIYHVKNAQRTFFLVSDTREERDSWVQFLNNKAQGLRNSVEDDYNNNNSNS
jgi:kinesin family protein 5